MRSLWSWFVSVRSMNARDEPRERLCVMYPVVVIIVLVVLEDDDKEDSSSMVCKYCVTCCNGT